MGRRVRGRGHVTFGREIIEAALLEESAKVEGGVGEALWAVEQVGVTLAMVGGFTLCNTGHVNNQHSPRPYLYVVGMLLRRACPLPFYLFFFLSVLVSISVFMALSTVFHSINSPDNSSLSHFVLPVLSLPFFGPFNYRTLYESLHQP